GARRGARRGRQVLHPRLHQRRLRAARALPDHRRDAAPPAGGLRARQAGGRGARGRGGARRARLRDRPAAHAGRPGASRDLPDPLRVGAGGAARLRDRRRQRPLPAPARRRPGRPAPAAGGAPAAGRLQRGGGALRDAARGSGRAHPPRRHGRARHRRSRRPRDPGAPHARLAPPLAARALALPHLPHRLLLRRLARRARARVAAALRQRRDAGRVLRLVSRPPRERRRTLRPPLGRAGKAPQRAATPLVSAPRLVDLLALARPRQWTKNAVVFAALVFAGRLGEARAFGLAARTGSAFRLAIHDVMAIAFGFLLRVEAGIAAIAAPESAWIVLCMFFVALLLGCGKRRAELAELAADAGGARRVVLGAYSLGFLDLLLAVSATTAIVCYALY